MSKKHKKKKGKKDKDQAQGLQLPEFVVEALKAMLGGKVEGKVLPMPVGLPVPFEFKSKKEVVDTHNMLQDAQSTLQKQNCSDTNLLTALAWARIALGWVSGCPGCHGQMVENMEAIKNAVGNKPTCGSDNSETSLTG